MIGFREGIRGLVTSHSAREEPLAAPNVLGANSSMHFLSFSFAHVYNLA